MAASVVAHRAETVLPYSFDIFHVRVPSSCLMGSGISPEPHPRQSISDVGVTLPQYSHLMRSRYMDFNLPPQICHSPVPLVPTCMSVTHYPVPFVLACCSKNDAEWSVSQCTPRNKPWITVPIPLLIVSTAHPTAIDWLVTQIAML